MITHSRDNNELQKLLLTLINTIVNGTFFGLDTVLTCSNQKKIIQPVIYRSNVKVRGSKIIRKYYSSYNTTLRETYKILSRN